jgi:hypothetical protein
MSAVFHGIELDGEGKPAYLRYGLLQLLYHFWVSRTEDARLTEWRERLKSDKFWHHLRHFRQLVDKFDRVAGYVGRLMEDAEGAVIEFQQNIERHNRGQSTGVQDPFSEFNLDMPIFLDSMLFYLRVQADSYSNLVRYFYPENDPPGGFNRQLRWFEDNPTFDVGYASILKTNRSWFEQLGRGGFRDIVAHASGMWGIGWEKQPDQPVIPKFSLFESTGVVEEDGFGALKQIISGWFEFLDKVYLHFVPRLAEMGILQHFSLNHPLASRFVSVREVRGFWLYPVIGEGE